MIRYERIEPELFANNRARLMNLLPPSSLAIIHSNDQMPRNGDQFFAYRQNSDFFYLSGLEEKDAVLILCPNHPVESLRQVLFIPEYSEVEQVWEGKKYSLESAGKVSGLRNVRYIKSLKTTLKEAMEFAETVFLNSNEYPKFVTEVTSKDLRFADRLRENFPAHNFSRLAPLLKELRLMKQSGEIKLIRKSCEISGEVFQEILNTTKPGMMEYETEAVIISGFIKRAAFSAYPPIVASGANACILHYTDNNCPMKDGDLMLLDFGAEYANYASDCSRTIPVNGKFSSRQLEVYNEVLGIFKEAKKLIRPGITINKLNQKVGLLMEEALIRLGLLKKEEVKNQDPENPLYRKYYMHGTSHFIGLDVHDPGTRDVSVLNGMVLSVEPGIYIPEENIGIRIENTVLLNDTVIDLMENIPIEATDIEMMMSN